MSPTQSEIKDFVLTEFLPGEDPNELKDDTPLITGGILGIIAMRLVIGQLLTLVQKYPALVDGAFVIIGWVAIKLFLEYAHQMGWVHFTIPKMLSLGLIVVIFGVSYLIARKQGPKEIDEEKTRVIANQD